MKKKTSRKNSSTFLQNVFINCPFDEQYAPLFQAITFTVHRVGFRPRCTKEVLESGGSRLEKIMDIIADCKYGIHDLSRTQLGKYKLPRFNMPFELGIDIGFRRCGDENCKSKSHLILDTHPYRYHKFISDLGGRDIHPHGNSPRQAVIRVRNWLTAEASLKGMPSGKTIFREYRQFLANIPKICERSSLHANDMTFADYSYVIADFLETLKTDP
jgi:hypothetical protein